jgi:hypothetical protein
VRVDVLGPVRVTGRTATADLAVGQLAVLALLVAHPGPISFEQLANGCALGADNIRAYLSKLGASKLRLPRGVRLYIRAGPYGSGRILPNPEIIDSDVIELAGILASPVTDHHDLRRGLSLIRGPSLAGVPWPRSGAVSSAFQRLAGLRADLVARAGRSDLVRLGTGGWLIDTIDEAEPLTGELWLARVARAAVGADHARLRALFDEPDVPAAIEVGTAPVPVTTVGAVLAAAITASAGPGAPAGASRSRAAPPPAPDGSDPGTGSGLDTRTAPLPVVAGVISPHTHHVLIQLAASAGSRLAGALDSDLVSHLPALERIFGQDEPAPWAPAPGDVAAVLAAAHPSGAVLDVGVSSGQIDQVGAVLEVLASVPDTFRAVLRIDGSVAAELIADQVRAWRLMNRTSIRTGPGIGGGHAPAPTWTEQRALATVGLVADASGAIRSGLAARLLAAVEMTWEDLPRWAIRGVERPGAGIDWRLRDLGAARSAESTLMAHELQLLHHIAYTELARDHDQDRDRESHRACARADHALGAAAALPAGAVLQATEAAAEACLAAGDSSGCHRYTVAALRFASTAPRRRRLLELRADADRRRGRWDAARPTYRSLIDEALADRDPARACDLTLNMADACWDAGESAEVADIAVSIRARLSTTDPLRRGQLDLCLAGGLDQDGTAGADRVGIDRIARALDLVHRQRPSPDTARSLIHGRQALLGVIPPRASLGLALAAVRAAGDDTERLAHALHVTFVDQLRLDHRGGAVRTLARLRELAERPATTTQVANFLSCQICWDLFLGRLRRAERTMRRFSELRQGLGGDTFTQIQLAQLFWSGRQRGERSELISCRLGSRELHLNDPATPIWAIAEALLCVDLGLPDEATQLVTDVWDRYGVELPAGPHRLAQLAMLSEIVGRVDDRASLPETMAASLYTAMRHDGQRGVLAGWPTVYLGTIDRYLGYAAAASGRPRLASSHLRAAAHRDRWIPSQRELTATARAASLEPGE